jgi:hypothetical protein
MEWRGGNRFNEFSYCSAIATCVPMAGSSPRRRQHLFPLTISHALFDEAFGVLRDALTSPAGRPHCPRASGQPGRLRRALS